MIPEFLGMFMSKLLAGDFDMCVRMIHGCFPQISSHSLGHAQFEVTDKFLEQICAKVSVTQKMNV